MKKNTKNTIKLIVLLVLAMSFVLFELSTIKANQGAPPKVTFTKPIPNQHIIFFAKRIKPDGSFEIITVIIPKGHLNPDNEGVYWQTIENYKKQMEMDRKFREHEKKSLKEYKKKHPEAFGKKEPV